MHFLSLLPLSISFFATCLFATCHLPALRHVLFTPSQYSFTFASPTANSGDVIRFLGILFIRYHKPLAMYCDRGQHFDSQETKTYLRDEGVNLNYSAFGSSKSTRMVEVGNRLLQEVLRNSSLREWDEKLAPATQQINARVIQNLQVAPSAIFFGVQATVASLDSVLAFVPTSSVDGWVEKVVNLATHFAAIRKHRNYRAQMHDRMRQLALEKQEMVAIRYKAGVTEIFTWRGRWLWCIRRGLLN